MGVETHRKRYDYYMPFDADQMALIAEGLEVLRLYAQSFNDCDGRAKVTRIKKLENRIQRQLQRSNQ